ncbi:MAG: hypothetical protein WCQ69_07395 [Bacteroidales bacterium]|jgi:hypothetical protein
MTERNKEQVKSTFRMEDDPADTAKVLRASFRLGAALLQVRNTATLDEGEAALVETAINSISWIGANIARSNGFSSTDMMDAFLTGCVPPARSEPMECCIQSHEDAVEVVTSLFIRGMTTGGLSEVLKESGQIASAEVLSHAGTAITLAAKDVAAYWDVESREVIDAIRAMDEGLHFLAELVEIALYGNFTFTM